MFFPNLITTLVSIYTNYYLLVEEWQPRYSLNRKGSKTLYRNRRSNNRTCDIADDLSYWNAEIPGKAVAKTEALTGPTTPSGKRVQTINPHGSEVGSGAAGAVATWGTSVADKVDAMGFKWGRKGRSSKHIPFEWSCP